MHGVSLGSLGLLQVLAQDRVRDRLGQAPLDEQVHAAAIFPGERQCELQGKAGLSLVLLASHPL